MKLIAQAGGRGDEVGERKRAAGDVDGDDVAVDVGVLRLRGIKDGDAHERPRFQRLHLECKAPSPAARLAQLAQPASPDLTQSTVEFGEMHTNIFPMKMKNADEVVRSAAHPVPALV